MEDIMDIQPKSDQLNADDLIDGSRTVTISAVTRGTPEQPVNIELKEYPGRPYRPSKGMRRVLVQAWGRNPDAYVGKRITLFRNPDITFGRARVGGIQISHLSGIQETLETTVTVRRGQRAPFTVRPIPGGPTITDVDNATTVGELKELWESASPDVKAAIRRRVTEVSTANSQDDQ